MSGYFTVAGSDAGPTGSRSLGPWSVDGSADVAETLDMALVPGDNVVLAPSGSVAVALLPPPGSGPVKMRTNLNVTDGGLPLATVAAGQKPVPVMYPLANGVNTIYLNATTGVSGFYLVFV